MDINNDYGVKGIQEKLLELMTKFDEICRDGKVNYSLYAGSLLGAVREHGFIQWDDDSDVLMTVNEYKKLKKILLRNKEFILDEDDAWLPRFREKCIENGPFVDIFLITNAPNNKIKFNIKVARLRILQGLLKKYQSLHSHSLFYRIVSKIARFIGGLLPRKKLLKKYKRIAFKNVESDYLQIPNGSFYGIKNRFEKKKLLENYVDIDFEGKKFMVFRNYTYILKIIYGPDYMTPPPIKERYGGHSNQISM